MPSSDQCQEERKSRVSGRGVASILKKVVQIDLSEK